MSSVTDELAKLIAMPTQQAGGQGSVGDERAICDYLAEQLRRRGADDVIVESSPRADGTPGAYVFARWGTPVRVINAHVDTVPANAGWSRSPWTPHVADDRIYGLGSADTKGAIAATLVALDRAKPTDRGVLFSGDEEAGSAVMRAFLRSSHAAPIRQAIVCEPTGRTAGIAHRGIVGQRAVFEGRGGHSSKADAMPKPVVELAKLAVAIDELGISYLNRGPAGMTGLCTNIAALHGGVAPNVVPHAASLQWSLRPYPGFDVIAWTEEITARARAIHPGISVSTMMEHPSFRCAHPESLIALVEPHVQSIGNLDFWTEAALFAAQGIDAIVVGPGEIGQAHAGDEFVAIDDLHWAVDLLRNALFG